MDPLSWNLLFLNILNFDVDAAVTTTAADDTNVLVYIVLLIVLIALNAYFAMSELAVVSLNEARIEKLANEGNKKAKSLLKMTSQPTTFLSTIQIGVTLSGFLSSAVASDTFADYIVVWFANTSIDPSVVRMVSIFVITLLLSFVTLVFGELLPKRIAQKNPEKVARAGVVCVIFCYTILSRIVFLVSKTVNAIARSIGISETDGQSEYSEEDIRIMVDAGNEKGYIEEEEKNMINNVFDFNDRTVGEIMTHRTDMVSLEINDPLDKVLQTFNDNGYSRIPVYSEDIDNIEGFLYVKDVFRVLTNHEEADFKIENYLREPLFVYENMRCDDLMAVFQKEKVQVALVLDEYGGTYGIVSMEDLLESIVGNIQDEYDNEDEEITTVTENHYIVDGATLIEDISKLTNVEFDDSENDTIGGLIMDTLGRVPDEDENPEVIINNVSFKIKSMDDQSIDKIDVVVLPKEGSTDGSQVQDESDL